MAEYIFTDKRGNVLDEQICDDRSARSIAQRLAQQFGGRAVIIAEFVAMIEPVKCECGGTVNTEFICPDCGRIAPETILRASK